MVEVTTTRVAATRRSNNKGKGLFKARSGFELKLVMSVAKTGCFQNLAKLPNFSLSQDERTDLD